MRTLTETSFIPRDELYNRLEDAQKLYTKDKLQDILHEALKLKGLSLDKVALLLQAETEEDIRLILSTAHQVKEAIYGKRMVLFAPLYIGNYCSNNCLYCAFRKDNTALGRAKLTYEEIEEETKMLLRQGHKRILMLTGEDERTPLDYFLEAIRRVYATRDERGSSIRRINVEIAPLDIDGFRRLKAEKIGTYACFQETYDEILYKKYHPSGPKSDYLWRLFVMDRAMEGGIDDVGIGVLFGLADYRFEVLSLLVHAYHLERKFGCGPHTVSVPRIEPAEGAPLSTHIPYPVSDRDFKKIVAIIRLALPYTGIILSTRESETLRQELFHYGVSQISAGSRTNPGAYSHPEEKTGSQFSLGDHRSLDEVISALIDDGFIPSFCTGCYRKGRVGQDFMDLAKPGLIQKFCMPNGLFSFREYLEDYASPQTREKGLRLIQLLVSEIEDKNLKTRTEKGLYEVAQGKRDVYY
ncbi:[FeFe]-hydrogenase maturation protein HydG [Brevinematales bacterium NS]|nr:[FeFe] hydrogenase H-cluster radical SAM maturase HydG [Brevinematales bacterium]QJR22882.1 [FeFe]-hydrogenase maturation protein HydG [Brevinematales bacterium NS]